MKQYKQKFKQGYCKTEGRNTQFVSCADFPEKYICCSCFNFVYEEPRKLEEERWWEK